MLQKVRNGQAFQQYAPLEAVFLWNTVVDTGTTGRRYSISPCLCPGSTFCPSRRVMCTLSRRERRDSYLVDWWRWSGISSYYGDLQKTQSAMPNNRQRSLGRKTW